MHMEAIITQNCFTSPDFNSMQKFLSAGSLSKQILAMRKDGAKFENYRDELCSLAESPREARDIPSAGRVRLGKCRDSESQTRELL